jgi:hypothetical protein
VTSHTRVAPVPIVRDWNPAYDGGDCSDADPVVRAGFFPTVYDDDAPVVVPNAIIQLCALCPVVDKCLAWAMTNDAYGIWAGTSRFQRLQLSRDQHRVKCPGCASTSVMNDGRSEVCLSCGISWMI